jgi:hypothetical protein
MADFGEYSQDVINTQFGDSWDIYIGILWARYGTITAKGVSGTEEEFDLAYERWNSDNRSCKVAVFFSHKAFQASDVRTAEQNLKVQIFREKVGNLGGLYETYGDELDFVFRVRDYLSRAILEYGKTWGKTLPELGIEKAENHSPLLTFVKSSDTTLLQLFSLLLTSFMTYTITFSETSRLSSDFISQFNNSVVELKGSKDRKANYESAQRIKAAFIAESEKASSDIVNSLPKLRTSWGSLSTILFELVTRLESEIKTKAHYSQLRTLHETINKLSTPIESLQDTYMRTEAMFRNADWLSGYTKQSLSLAFEGLNNELLLVKSESEDLANAVKRLLDKDLSS